MNDATSELEQKIREDFIPEYIDIFDFADSAEKLTPDDEPLKFKPIEAVGVCNNTELVVKRFLSSTPEETEFDWNADMQGGHIAKAFLIVAHFH